MISSQLQVGSFGECASSSTALLHDAHTCTRCSGGRWKELWTVTLEVSLKVRGQVSLAQCVLSTSSADPQEGTESFNSFHHLQTATVFTVKERTGKAGHPVPTMTPQGTARERGALRRGSSGRESRRSEAAASLRAAWAWSHRPQGKCGARFPRAAGHILVNHQTAALALECDWRQLVPHVLCPTGLPWARREQRPPKQRQCGQTRG